MDDNDDIPILSASALAALQNFYTERDQDLETFERIKSHDDQTDLTISMFKEDWNASQFWFTDATAKHLATQLLRDVNPETTIAVLSAPSVFIQLTKLLSTGEYPRPHRVCLLEFDERFELLEGFVRYDFNDMSSLSLDLKDAFDVILCDPPYHSTECIEKYAQAVEWLRSKRTDDGKTSMRVVCTGEKLSEDVIRAFDGVSEMSFRPEHTVRLDNKYACFSDVAFPA